MLAVLLPASWLMLARTPQLDGLYHLILTRGIAKWFTLAGLVALIGAECHLLEILVCLSRARGRLDTFRSLVADPAGRAGRRRWKFRLVTGVLSTTLAFGLMESAFRAFDIRPGALPPTVYADHEKVDNTRNGLGIREDWDTIAEDDPRLRIAMLGDSMTYGESVEPHETFCHLVEGLLARDVPQGVVTINLGEAATGPAEQREIYLSVGAPLRPDIVLHIVYPNDLGHSLNALLYDIYRIRDDELWVGEFSYVLRYAERQIRYWIAWDKTIDYFHGGETRAERAETWVRFKADVRACKAAAEEDGAVYALVLFPWLVRLDDYLLADLHGKVSDFASELSVPYLDLLDVFAGRDGDTLRVSLANIHPNAEGHRMAAERIVRFLREEVLPSLPR